MIRKWKCVIAEIVSISTERMVNIFHTHLCTERGMGSLAAAGSAGRTPWHMDGRHFQPRIKYRLWRFRRLSAWLEIWHGLLACRCPAWGPPNSRNRQPTVHVWRADRAATREPIPLSMCMRKLYARWVPRLLTIDQKRIRVTTLERNLAYFNLNPKELLRWFVTMDGTWIHHYTPESREGSKEWVKPGESAPKRPKT